MFRSFEKSVYTSYLHPRGRSEQLGRCGNGAPLAGRLQASVDAACVEPVALRRASRSGDDGSGARRSPSSTASRPRTLPQPVAGSNSAPRALGARGSLARWSSRDSGRLASSWMGASWRWIPPVPPEAAAFSGRDGDRSFLNIEPSFSARPRLLARRGSDGVPGGSPVVGERGSSPRRRVARPDHSHLGLEGARGRPPHGEAARPRRRQAGRSRPATAASSVPCSSTRSTPTGTGRRRSAGVTSPSGNSARTSPSRGCPTTRSASATVTASAERSSR